MTIQKHIQKPEELQQWKCDADEKCATESQNKYIKSKHVAMQSQKHTTPEDK